MNTTKWVGVHQLAPVWVFYPWTPPPVQARKQVEQGTVGGECLRKPCISKLANEQS